MSQVNVNVNVNVNDHTNTQQTPVEQDHVENIANKVSNHLHNPLDKLISFVARKILKAQEIFIVKARGLTARALKALLLQYIPSATMKVAKIAPALLAIAL